MSADSIFSSIFPSVVYIVRTTCILFNSMNLLGGIEKKSHISHDISETYITMQTIKNFKFLMNFKMCHVSAL